MNLEDLLIMEVPAKSLQHISSSNKLKPGGNSIEHYAKAIANNPQTISIGESLASIYRFAGRTAVSLYQPEQCNFFDIGDVKRYLIKKYGNEVFNNEIRPDLSDQPKLFKIHEIDDKLILAFTFLGKETRFLRNFKLTKERLQYVDYVVFRFNPFIVELRSAIGKVPIFKKVIREVLNQKEDMEWFNFSELSENEAQDLKNNLGCFLTGAKHKMTEGIYDTIEVKANTTIEDLSLEVEYKQTFSGKPYRSMTFRFPFKHNYGLEELITMKISPNGVNFSSTVSEEVIDYVIQNIMQIKSQTVLAANVAK